MCVCGCGCVCVCAAVVRVYGGILQESFAHNLVSHTISGVEVLGASDNVVENISGKVRLVCAASVGSGLWVDGVLSVYIFLLLGGQVPAQDCGEGVEKDGALLYRADGCYGAGCTKGCGRCVPRDRIGDYRWLLQPL